MCKKLEGKVIVTTGCASGLGKQFAIRFANEGAKLAICDRVESKLMDTMQLCEEAGAEVLAVRCDVGVYEDLVAFVEMTVERFGTIDVLVNNAQTIINPRSFLEYSLEDLDTEMHTGLYATWHMMKLCFPYMRDKPGSIINLGSRGGVEGSVHHASYAAVKEAIRGVSRVVAREWGQYNIRVNVVCPGAWTDNFDLGLQNQKQEVQEWVHREIRANAMGRIGDPYSDVAPALVFLASDESRWITGQTLHVEGGLWMNA